MLASLAQDRRALVLEAVEEVPDPADTWKDDEVAGEGIDEEFSEYGRPRHIPLVEREKAVVDVH